MRHIRLKTLLFITVLIPLGFFCKYYAGPFENWVNDSLAGVLYVTFWCLAVFLVRDSWSPRSIAVGVLCVTCLLEVLQLWHPPFLQMIRSTFLGKTLLGTSFAWSDFPHYLAGAILGYGWMRINKKLL